MWRVVFKWMVFTPLGALKLKLLFMFGREFTHSNECIPVQKRITNIQLNLLFQPSLTTNRIILITDQRDRILGTEKTLNSLAKGIFPPFILSVATQRVFFYMASSNSVYLEMGKISPYSCCNQAWHLPLFSFLLVVLSNRKSPMAIKDRLSPVWCNSLAGKFSLAGISHPSV